MAKIIVTDRQGETLAIEGRVGVSIMETLRELDHGVEALCGGMCSCCTCHCYIEPEWFARLPGREADEEELLAEGEDYRPESSRLSCQVEFTPELDGIRLTVAPEQ
jgi:ferredoxin, 2Fe-2S